MKRATIEITIDKDGSIKADVLNGRGADCLDQLDELLGDLVDVTEKDTKPEFYQEVKKKQDNKKDIYSGGSW